MPRTAKPKPPLTCRWLCRPVDACLSGVLKIGSEMYLVREYPVDVDSPGLVRLWDVAKIGATGVYRLTLDVEGNLACDCPDAVYRQHACKHTRSLGAAYRQLGGHWTHGLPD